MTKSLRILAIAFVATCSPFWSVIAFSADVPSDVHRKCKGATDYSGCVRLNTTYRNSEGSPQNYESASPRAQQDPGSSRGRFARPARDQAPDNRKPSSSTAGGSNINLTNEKNITIESNKTNILKSSPSTTNTNETRRRTRSRKDADSATNTNETRRRTRSRKDADSTTNTNETRQRTRSRKDADSTTNTNETRQRTRSRKKRN